MPGRRRRSGEEGGRHFKIVSFFHFFCCASYENFSLSLSLFLPLSLSLSLIRYLLLYPRRRHGIVERKRHPRLPAVPKGLGVAPDGQPLVPDPQKLLVGAARPHLRHPGLLREQRAVAGPVRGVGVPAAPDVVGHGGVGAHDAGGGGLDGDAGAAVFLEEREKR